MNATTIATTIVFYNLTENVLAYICVYTSFHLHLSSCDMLKIRHTNRNNKNNIVRKIQHQTLFLKLLFEFYNEFSHCIVRRRQRRPTDERVATRANNNCKLFSCILAWVGLGKQKINLSYTEIRQLCLRILHKDMRDFVESWLVNKF